MYHLPANTLSHPWHLNVPESVLVVGEIVVNTKVYVRVDTLFKKWNQIPVAQHILRCLSFLVGLSSLHQLQTGQTPFQKISTISL